MAKLVTCKPSRYLREEADEIEEFLDSLVDDVDATRLEFERLFEKYADKDEGKFWEYD